MGEIDWCSVPAEEVYPGISRQILDGELQTMVRYVYQPGSEFPLHNHPQEQITVVVSGQIALTVAGSTMLLSGGHAAVIPANVPHGARVIGDQVVETFNSMSPRRERHPSPGTGPGEAG